MNQTNRLEKTFSDLKKKDQAALVTFITSGDPDFKTCDNNTVVLYKTFNEWAKLNNCNITQMKNGFVKIFQSLIPSPKWDAWMNGQELCGYTNNPPF